MAISASDTFSSSQRMCMTSKTCGIQACFGISGDNFEDEQNVEEYTARSRATQHCTESQGRCSEIFSEIGRKSENLSPYVEFFWDDNSNSCSVFSGFESSSDLKDICQTGSDKDDVDDDNDDTSDMKLPFSSTRHFGCHQQRISHNDDPMMMGTDVICSPIGRQSFPEADQSASEWQPQEQDVTELVDGNISGSQIIKSDDGGLTSRVVENDLNLQEGDVTCNSDETRLSRASHRSCVHSVSPKSLINDGNQQAGEPILREIKGEDEEEMREIGVGRGRPERALMRMGIVQGVRDTGIKNKKEDEDEKQKDDGDDEEDSEQDDDEEDEEEDDEEFKNSNKVGFSMRSNSLLTSEMSATKEKIQGSNKIVTDCNLKVKQSDAVATADDLISNSCSLTRISPLAISCKTSTTTSTLLTLLKSNKFLYHNHSSNYLNQPTPVIRGSSSSENMPVPIYISASHDDATVTHQNVTISAMIPANNNSNLVSPPTLSNLLSTAVNASPITGGIATPRNQLLTQQTTSARYMPHYELFSAQVRSAIGQSATPVISVHGKQDQQQQLLQQQRPQQQQQLEEQQRQQQQLQQPQQLLPQQLLLHHELPLQQPVQQRHPQQQQLLQQPPQVQQQQHHQPMPNQSVRITPLQEQPHQSSLQLLSLQNQQAEQLQLKSLQLQQQEILRKQQQLLLQIQKRQLQPEQQQHQYQPQQKLQQPLQRYLQQSIQQQEYSLISNSQDERSDKQTHPLSNEIGPFVVSDCQNGVESLTQYNVATSRALHGLAENAESQMLPSLINSSALSPFAPVPQPQFQHLQQQTHHLQQQSKHLKPQPLHQDACSYFPQEPQLEQSLQCQEQKQNQQLYQSPLSQVQHKKPQQSCINHHQPYHQQPQKQMPIAADITSNCPKISAASTDARVDSISSYLPRRSLVISGSSGMSLPTSGEGASPSLTSGSATVSESTLLALTNKLRQRSRRLQSAESMTSATVSQQQQRQGTALLTTSKSRKASGSWTVSTHSVKRRLLSSSSTVSLRPSVPERSASLSPDLGLCLDENELVAGSGAGQLEGCKVCCGRLETISELKGIGEHCIVSQMGEMKTSNRLTSSVIPSRRHSVGDTLCSNESSRLNSPGNVNSQSGSASGLTHVNKEPTCDRLLSVAKRAEIVNEFQFFLDAPMSTIRRPDQEKVTYLNKGQYYRLSLEQLSSLTASKQLDKTVKSVVMVVFRDGAHVGDELNAWKLWHAKQQSFKQRILDIDYKNSCGVQPDSMIELGYNATAITWTPQTQNHQPAKVNLAVHCLSTDFSNQKGVKGIPLHIQIDSYRSSPESDKETLVHRASCKIKVFCDKGAERKVRDEDRRKEIIGGMREGVRAAKPDINSHDQLSYPVSLTPSPSASSSSSSSSSISSSSSPKLVLYDTDNFKDTVSNFVTMSDLGTNPVLLSPEREHISGRNDIVTATATTPNKKTTPAANECRDGGTVRVNCPDSHYCYNSSVTSPASKRPRIISSCTSATQNFQRVLLYLRQDNEDVFAAVLVEPPTVQALVTAIKAMIKDKTQAETGRFHNVYKQSKRGILVRMDDQILRHYSNESTFILSTVRSLDDSRNNRENNNKGNNNTDVAYDFILKEIDVGPTTNN